MDIFLSYARKDIEVARLFLRKFEQEGFQVWFDERIATSSRWESELKIELERARCVVMLWSENANNSNWVIQEGKNGLERTVLVPILIQNTEIEKTINEIQFADLTSWDGISDTPEFNEILQTIYREMLPVSEIRFQSLLEPDRGDLKLMIDSFIRTTGRFSGVNNGKFRIPSNPTELFHFQRTIASLSVIIKWSPEILDLLNSSLDKEIWKKRIRNIERRLPLIWLGLLNYSNPFFSGCGARVCVNYLRFSSLMIIHSTSSHARLVGKKLKYSPPLSQNLAKSARWEVGISVLFTEPDEVAAAYVTEIGGTNLLEEIVVYGPQYDSQRAYGRSLARDLYSYPTWLEQYLLPQYELSMALDGSIDFVSYNGNARIRKVTNFNGADLDPLIDV